jgi:putative transposase
MPRYRRSRATGGTFIFTVTLADRGSCRLVEHIDRLRRAYGITQSRLPFQTVAICVLPDHLHAIWQLPDGDADFGRRWSSIKRLFSAGFDAVANRTASKLAKREKASGNGAFGNVKSATRRIWLGMRITSTSTR